MRDRGGESERVKESELERVKERESEREGERERERGRGRERERVGVCGREPKTSVCEILFLQVHMATDPFPHFCCLRGKNLCYDKAMWRLR